ncbi:MULTISPECIES: DUF2848 domain-containing protein [Bradyrhizobium]|uniref:DUF2848 domain-containing protein n=1 Tax=Bradyrhizobium elkanii TaxID=29448 RepID=A0A8I1Y2F6_BRAEL|nr:MULTISPECIES: DUF2848 domain-containing protein [Bradyrhizobium]MBP1291135.1 hypothetical protein [Bradyrhizobium elkanii]MCP1928548.1 hypothetical protein [Bradyrhizobium elkanii]MCS3580836.1 hypothetical protein [Bradyrhizobium elkanii]MCS3723712.1 hypothetical protein [Bradyrhizobium elkanii]MCS4008122.1 hypothetical protein [Bradyrhizobium elkanii USDA 61]
MLLQFERLANDRTDRIAVEIGSLVIAGWAGRDAAAIEHHIEELAALGIPRPSTTPLYYRVAAQTLTQDSRLVVLGPDSSGEVEPVIVAMADGLWVGIGSDHTDRNAEASGIALSKQLCGKPVGSQLWSYADIEGHWDELVLRSWATIDGKRALYQDSPVSSLRTPRDLIRRYTGTDMLSAGTLMFCGTPGAIGGIRPGTRFEMELTDPVLNRSLTHSYDVRVLPVVS